MTCPLGFDSTLCEGERCENQEACHFWTSPRPLYDLIILKGLPGALYLPCENNYEWTEETWGFFRLNNCDFLMWHCAQTNDFQTWQKVYHILKARWKYGIYIRQECKIKFEQLRCSIDSEYAKGQEALSNLSNLFGEF